MLGIRAAEAEIAASAEPLGGVAKRVTDIVLASLGLILLAPLMLIVGALVRIFLGGPAVVSQARIGFAGTIFNCYRFRTMAAVADDGSGCLGRVLRESGIDELPQLFNVLRGDMSLVGPRPVVAGELKYYGRHLRHYLSARPGLTGVWQTGGRGPRNDRERAARDRYYVRHWSTGLDLALLARSLAAALNKSA